MGWIACFRCETFQWDFVARTFTPILHIFHQVLRANQTVPTALNLYGMHKNMSLGSNGCGSGVFVAKNSDGTSWHEVFHQFDPFYTKCCYATKLSQMHPNNTKHTKT